MSKFIYNLKWCVIIIIAMPLLALAWIIKKCFPSLTEVHPLEKNKCENPEITKYKGCIGDE